MTPEQRQVRFRDRISELEFKLHKAEHGLAMPYDYREVLYLRQILQEAREIAELDAKTHQRERHDR